MYITMDIKLYHKKYREDHREALSEYNKEYREKNREQLKEYSKKYAEENKERLINYRKEYYARKKKENSKDYEVRKTLCKSTKPLSAYVIIDNTPQIIKITE